MKYHCNIFLGVQFTIFQYWFTADQTTVLNLILWWPGRLTHICVTFTVTSGVSNRRRLDRLFRATREMYVIFTNLWHIVSELFGNWESNIYDIEYNLSHKWLRAFRAPRNTHSYIPMAEPFDIYFNAMMQRFMISHYWHKKITSPSVSCICWGTLCFIINAPLTNMILDLFSVFTDLHLNSDNCLRVKCSVWCLIFL